MCVGSSVWNSCIHPQVERERVCKVCYSCLYISRCITANVYNIDCTHTHTHTHTQSQMIEENCVMAVLPCSLDDILLRMRGLDLTIDFLEEHGFDKPILVENKDDLGLRVPPPSFKISDIERCVGMHYGLCTMNGYMYVVVFPYFHHVKNR